MQQSDTEKYREKLEIIRSACRVLLGEWEDAEGMLELFSSPHVTRESIDGMIAVFENAFQKVKDQKVRKTMETALEKIRTLREREELERRNDASDATGLIGRGLL